VRITTGVKVGLGLVVSAVCLWLAILQAPLAEVAERADQVNYWWLIPCFLANVVQLWGRGARWRVLLGERGTNAELFWAQCIGTLLTNIFPLRAGEAGRVVIVSRRLGIPLVQVGASVVLERAVDMAVVLSMLATLLLIMDVPWPITATGLALGAALAVAWIGVVVLLMFGKRLTGLVEAILGRLPLRLARLGMAIWGQVLTALEPLRDARIVLKVVVWTVIIWLATWATLWTSIEAVAPGSRPIEASFALTAIALGIALPSSPGFIGVFQLVGQQALVRPFPDRYTDASALVVTLFSHAVSYVTNSGLGLLGLARLGISMRTARAAEPDTAIPPAASS